MTSESATVADDDGILSSLRYLFADFLGDEDATRPVLPEGLPESVAAVASDAIDLLIDYQSTGYAQLYVDRLRRFVGRRDVDEAMLADIARLMAHRMAYEDPIRIAQLKLCELDDRGAQPGSVDIRRFRFDELVGSLPAAVAEPVLDMLEWLGWSRRTVKVRFSTRNRFSIRRLKLEAALKRWRLFSVRYAKERVWVERWLHMINRSLAKQPAGALAVIQTATMIEGYGASYRQGLADWHMIIDDLAKPTFDGVLALPDLAGAIAEARAAAMPDPRQAALKRKIAEIRARLPAGANAAAG
ncbi:DUF6537 domain-containing protein [Bradyrhizobium cenepequi]|uniref:DUF6537 domain-containing protein n=1 Tax=Bradyrhizobium cenepequi TaxID=2821403 RepID=UPI001CE257AB|nr:DUF6537 domain-containing protein [Bradyrhizobium cenepequi]MCA6109209.1 hypothetical protein [Bradyrhizobium cenepequi]